MCKYIAIQYLWSLTNEYFFCKLKTFLCKTFSCVYIIYSTYAYLQHSYNIYSLFIKCFKTIYKCALDLKHDRKKINFSCRSLKICLWADGEAPAPAPASALYFSTLVEDDKKAVIP